MDSKYKKLGKNTVLVFIGQAGSSLVSLLMLPLYTNWLSTEEYGTVDLMSTYAAILLSLMSCCLADSIFIFPKDADNKGKKQYFSTGLFFVLLSFILFSTINFILSFFYNKGSFFYSYSWYTLLLTVSMFLQVYMQQFTRSLEKMTVFATTGIVYTLCVALSAIILIPIYKLEGYIFSLIIANFIAALYSFLCSKSYSYLGLPLSIGHLKQLLSYGIPLIPNSIMWWMVNGMNRPIMESYLGMSAIGLYAVASKFPGVVSMLTNVFSNAWGISMLDEFGKSGFNDFFNKTFKLITLVSFVPAFLLIVFSKGVIMFFSSAAFFEAWHVLPVLIIGAMLNTSTGIVGGVFMGMKKSKYFFYSSAVSAIVAVVFTFVFIKAFGLIGCAIASTISFLFALVLRIKFAWSYIKGFDLAHYVIIIIALIVTNIILESSLTMVVKILLYIFVFGTVLFLNRQLLGSMLTVITEAIRKK